jgi:hypothetical protein
MSRLLPELDASHPGQRSGDVRTSVTGRRGGVLANLDGYSPQGSDHDWSNTMHPILISFAARGAYKVAKAVIKSRQAQMPQTENATVWITEQPQPAMSQPVSRSEDARTTDHEEPAQPPIPRPQKPVKFSPPAPRIGGIGNVPNYNGGWRPGNVTNYNPGRNW